MRERARHASTKVGGLTESPAALARPVPLERLSGESYERLFRLCFGALGLLAREGFVVPPDEGVDLVHEFLVSQWGGLCDRYDARKGAFPAYAHAAFLRFARRSIIRLRSWERRLEDFSSLRDEAGAAGRVSPSGADPYDIDRVRTTVGRLPEPERAVLAWWLGGATERGIARALRASRYRVREMLVESVGRIAVGVGEQTAFRHSAWEVADALWRQGYPPHDAARRLGRSLEEIHAARHEIFAEIVAALTSQGHPASWSKKDEEMDGSLELLTDALSHPGDAELLRRVRDSAHRIRKALAASDAGETEPPEIPEASPEWIASVYEALSEEPQLPAEEQEAARRLAEASAQREDAIGRAFEDLLLPGLPDDLVDLERYFDGCPTAPKAVVASLAEDPSTQGAGPVAEPLVQVGITPLMVLQATKATAALVRRLVRHRGFPEPAMLEPAPGVLERPGQTVPCEAIYDAVQSATGSLREPVPLLHQWLVEVASHKPFLYPRLRAEVEGKGISLRRTGKPDTNLTVIWGVGRH